MTLRLVESGWDAEFDDAVRMAGGVVRLVSPFLSAHTARRVLRHGAPARLEVVTRFNLDDFAAGVSDLAALGLLLDHGAHIRGVRHLHAKVYVFGAPEALGRAIVTSANLTEAALTRNREFGLVADEPAVVQACHAYVDDLWGRAGTDITHERLHGWRTKVVAWRLTHAHLTAPAGLGDEGTDVGWTPPPVAVPDAAAAPAQAFVKFFGEGHDREPLTQTVLDEVRRSGCHWACTYPAAKRPQSVEDGAVMFMGRLVADPNDTRIYGRAVAMRHVPGRDDATAADIALRPWKATWPRYVRVHHPEFVNGRLGDGVSLNALMGALGSDAFASTQRNAAAGVGNTDPRRALRQQAAVRLTPQSTRWLNEALQGAFTRHGVVSAAALATLDWPAASPLSGVTADTL